MHKKSQSPETTVFLHLQATEKQAQKPQPLYCTVYLLFIQTAGSQLDKGCHGARPTTGMKLGVVTDSWIGNTYGTAIMQEHCKRSLLAKSISGQ